MEWISTEDDKPKEGQKALIKILLQRFVAGTHCEDEIVVTGGIKDGDWFAGNDMLIWDYDYNLGFNDDDVVAWMPLTAIK